MENMKLRILDYYDVLEEIKRITKNKMFKKEKSINTDLDNIEVPYYTLGKGNNHFVIVGGTHGSEIITTDFILRLMEEISKKRGIFSNIDLENDYTFHFIPIHNVEGYIISTSSIRTLIKKDFNEEKIEEIAKEYFLRYRQDDINVKKNPLDFSHKLHQKMFENVTYQCIPDEFVNLKKSVQKIYDNPLIPKGSIVVHRGNGLGEETNRCNCIDEIIATPYLNNRYNNINFLIPGPLGVTPERELNLNIFLEELIEKLYNEKKFAGMLSFHSTGGMIYSKINVDDIYNDCKLNKKKMCYINNVLLENYSKNTSYSTDLGAKEGYKVTDSLGLGYFDEQLRIKYPACLLIELSYMGGNPIGPYGDKKNNYVPTIESNLKASYYFFEKCKELKEMMYEK